MTTIIVAVVAVVATLLIAVPITSKVSVDIKVKKDAETIGSAEEKARGIIDEALKAAETKKRETLLEVRKNLSVQRTNWRRKPRNVETNCRNMRSVSYRRKKPLIRKLKQLRSARQSAQRDLLNCRRKKRE